MLTVMFDGLLVLDVGVVTTTGVEAAVGVALGVAAVVGVAVGCGVAVADGVPVAEAVGVTAGVGVGVSVGAPLLGSLVLGRLLLKNVLTSLAVVLSGKPVIVNRVYFLLPSVGMSLGSTFVVAPYLSFRDFSMLL